MDQTDALVPIPSVRRRLTRLFVICPEGLADDRWEHASKSIARYKPALPPIERINVNKNHLHFTGARRKEIFDNRSWRVRLGLRFSPPPERENFEACYGALFRGVNKRMNKIFPGELACSIAHIKAWRAVGDDDDLCMVLEDDAVLIPGLDANAVVWPRDANILHLHPPSVGRTAPGDKLFKPMLDETHRKPGVRNSPNEMTIGYIVSREGAEVLLRNFVPMPLNEPIDYALFDRPVKGLRPFSCAPPTGKVGQLRGFRSLVHQSRLFSFYKAAKGSFFAPALTCMGRLPFMSALKNILRQRMYR